MPITSHKRKRIESDEVEDIMPDVGPDAEQRARMRKPRGSARNAEPDFNDEGFTAEVYQRFNAKREPRHDEE